MRGKNLPPSPPQARAPPRQRPVGPRAGRGAWRWRSRRRQGGKRTTRVPPRRATLPADCTAVKTAPIRLYPPPPNRPTRPARRPVEHLRRSRRAAAEHVRRRYRAARGSTAVLELVKMSDAATVSTSFHVSGVGAARTMPVPAVVRAEPSPRPPRASQTKTLVNSSKSAESVDGEISRTPPALRQSGRLCSYNWPHQRSQLATARARARPVVARQAKRGG